MDKGVGIGEVIALHKALGGGGGSSGGGALVVNVTTDPETYAKSCDKTAGEIMAVANVGGIVVFKETYEDGSDIDYMISVEQNNRDYSFATGNKYTYKAESASDYPIKQNPQMTIR